MKYLQLSNARFTECIFKSLIKICLSDGNTGGMAIITPVGILKQEINKIFNIWVCLIYI